MMIKSKTFWFYLTACVSAILIFPIHNYQPFLSTGDHGRDLYAAEAVLRGEVPYQDFWWVYGPLMPYYYAGFMKFLGASIHSVLIGKCVLIFAQGLLFFLILSLLVSPVTAFLGSLWFLLFNSDFFFTYNHIGGITALFCVLYFLLLYITERSLTYLYLSLIPVILFIFIKINFGLIALLSVMATVILVQYFDKDKLDPSQKKFLKICILVPLIAAGIYGLFIRGLSIDEIRQCFPYLKEDHPYHTSMLDSLFFLFKQTWNFIMLNLGNTLFSLIVILSMIQTIYLLKKNAPDSKTKKNIIMLMIICTGFYILNLHEYLEGMVYYRSFWSLPVFFIFIFLCLGVTMRYSTRIIRILLTSALGAIILLQSLNHLTGIKFLKAHSAYLNHPKAYVYIGNNHGAIETVFLGVKFIEDHLKKDETFFALPYDPLYYFLTDKKSPTRQLIFFDHINIPSSQETAILQSLQKNNVKWVLISSRESSREEGLGTFGKSYCPKLGEYINNNFQEAIRFGDWQNPPGWAWNHGIKILEHIK